MDCCQECGEPCGPNPDGSEGVVVHFTEGGDRDHDADEDHVAVPDGGA